MVTDIVAFGWNPANTFEDKTVFFSRDIDIVRLDTRKFGQYIEIIIIFRYIYCRKDVRFLGYRSSPKKILIQAITSS